MLEGELRENLVSKRDWLIFISYNYKIHLKKKDNKLNVMYDNIESKINMRVCTRYPGFRRHIPGNMRW